MLQNQKAHCSQTNVFPPSLLQVAFIGMPVAELHSLLNEMRWWFERHKDSFVLLAKQNQFLVVVILRKRNLEKAHYAGAQRWGHTIHLQCSTSCKVRNLGTCSCKSCTLFLIPVTCWENICWHSKKKTIRPSKISTWHSQNSFLLKEID